MWISRTNDAVLRLEAIPKTKEKVRALPDDALTRDAASLSKGGDQTKMGQSCAGLMRPRKSYLQLVFVYLREIQRTFAARLARVPAIVGERGDQAGGVDPGGAGRVDIVDHGGDVRQQRGDRLVSVSCRRCEWRDAAQESRLGFAWTPL